MAAGLGLGEPNAGADGATLASGLVMPKGKDSFRKQVEQPGTPPCLRLVVLAMKIPHLDKLLRAGKIRMVGHPTSKKGAEVMTRLKTSRSEKVAFF